MVAKSNVKQIRVSLETANIYAKAGLEFVCIPVIDDKHRGELIVMAHNTLDRMADKADLEEK